MDLLFAAHTPWVWDAEKKFAELKEQQPDLVQAARRGEHVVDPEAGVLVHPANSKPEDAVHTESEEHVSP